MDALKQRRTRNDARDWQLGLAVSFLGGRPAMISTVTGAIASVMAPAMRAPD
jgi:hypothetical protein